jgi:hypothetical protein
MTTNSTDGTADLVIQLASGPKSYIRQQASNIMDRTAALTIAIATALFLSGCIGAGKLPDEFEEYESEYGFSIDLPEGWVVREQRMPSPGEFYLECYPSERNKNPDIELHIWNSSIERLDDFVRGQYGGAIPEGTTDYRIADMMGKKVVTQDGGDEHIAFYFQAGSERDWLEIRYYYGRLSFRRDPSSFDDAEWNMFVNRVAGSLEFED